MDSDVLHYAAATNFCNGGRNDTGGWDEVTCEDCLRSKPDPKATATLHRLMDAWHTNEERARQAKRVFQRQVLSRANMNAVREGMARRGLPRSPPYGMLAFTGKTEGE